MHIKADEDDKTVSPRQRTVLFMPLNAAGHINSSLAIANRLREDHSYRTVFVLVGPTLCKSIQNNGHELIAIDETDFLEDYELADEKNGLRNESNEGPSAKENQGMEKKQFAGAFKWPQMIARNQHNLEAPPKTEKSFKFITNMRAEALTKNLILNSLLLEQIIDEIDPAIIVSDNYFQPPKVLLEADRRPWVRIQSANPLILMRPKLVVGGGQGEAKKLIKPNASVGFKLYNREERDRMRQEEPEKWRAMVDEWAEWTQKVQSTYREEFAEIYRFYSERNCDHFKLDQFEMAISSPHLNIYMFPEAIDYDRDDDIVEYAARWLRCDWLIYQPSGQQELSELSYWNELLMSKTDGAGDKPVIFFSLGSIASGNLSLMQRYMDMLDQDTKDRVYVISKGVNGDRLELNGRNMMGGNYIPQTFLLQRANLAIIHGGNNSITECLYYGVPTIVLPIAADQFDNAQRIEDLELGKRLSLFNCSRDELLGAVDELLADGDLVKRVKSIGQKMRQRDELGKLSDVLSDLIEKQHLDEKTARKYGIKLE